MNYIVTFYSHFGAVRYKKQCDRAGITARMMPVPRTLSSSCGTCVRCQEEYLEPDGHEEIEQIVEEADAREIFSNPKHPYTKGLMQSIPQMTEQKPSRRVSDLYP